MVAPPPEPLGVFAKVGTGAGAVVDGTTRGTGIEVVDGKVDVTKVVGGT